MILKPVADKILLKLALVSEEKSKGGIVIVHKQSKMDNIGTIMDIGPSVDVNYWGIKVGDKILYENYAGKALEDDQGNQFLMIKPEEMCARVIGCTIL